MTVVLLKRSNQKGFTLLEVLIAVLVMSIGMVGLGALLLTALSNVHSSSQYSLASAIALDLEERLWHEVARQSTQDPPTLDGQGCLTSDQIDNVVDVLVGQWTSSQTDWQWGGTERFRSPGLAIVTNPPVISAPNAGISWQTIPVRVDWTEARFGLAEDTEQYQVNIAIVCRPTFL